ncbi:hypothetical protein ACP70R_034242 [Stipagrostis hirtigluma subsp. patula]
MSPPERQGHAWAFAGTEITMSWSDLPADLISAIAGRLIDLADLAHFRLVCPSWRSASAAHAARRRIPLLLVPTEDDYRTCFKPGVWSLTDDRFREFSLPSLRGLPYLFTSHHGWMLAVETALSAALVHPLAGGSVDLPALPTPFRSYREKLLRDLTWDWSPHGVVVSMPGRGAFFCRPGDGSWRPIGSSSAGVTRVTYCDGAFFLFEGKTCRVIVVDAGTLAVDAMIEPPLELEAYSSWLYEVSLVVSPDELLLVRTPLLISEENGWRVKVFRANRGVDGRSTSWSEIAGIGGRAVFVVVDHLRAFCVEADALSGLRGNFVYVARSYEEVHDDLGMDVSGRHTVAVLDIAVVEAVDISLKNQEKWVSMWWESWDTFWQRPSWWLPSLH